MSTLTQMTFARPPTIFSDQYYANLQIGRIGIMKQTITGLAGPFGPSDAVNKAYVDSHTTDPAPPNMSIQYNNNGTFGGSSNLKWSGSTLQVINPPVNSTDATNKAYVDGRIGGISTNVQFNNNGAFSGSNDFIWNDFTKFLYVNGTVILPNPPVNPTDATNKEYVDTITGSIPGGPAQSVQFNSNPSGIFSGTPDFTWDDTNKFMSVNGNVIAQKYITVSDVSLKTNINHINNPLEILNKIEGYTYNLLDSSDTTYGVLAQEIEQIDGLEKVVKTVGNKKMVDYQQFVPLLIESVKKISEMVSSSEDKGRCGDADRRCGDADRRCGDADRRCGDADRRCGDADRKCGDADRKCGDADRKCGDADRKCGDADRRFVKFRPPSLIKRRSPKFSLH